MKTKILLTVCLLQVISISIIGQLTYTPSKNSFTVVSGNKTYKIDNIHSTQSSYSISRNSNNVNNEIGVKLGEALGYALEALFRGKSNSNSPAPIYYDSKGIPCTSAKAAEAANKKYIFNKRKNDLLTNSKGLRPITGNNMEFKFSGLERTSEKMDFKFNGYGQTSGTMEFKWTEKINNISTEFEDSYGLEKYLEGLDFKPKLLEYGNYSYSLGQTPKLLPFHWNEFKTDLTDLGINIAEIYITAGTTLAAGALLGPEAAFIVKPVAAGSVRFFASLAHAANHGESMNWGVYKNAITDGVVAAGENALGSIPGKKGIVITSIYSGGKTLGESGNLKQVASNVLISAGKKGTTAVISHTVKVDTDLDNIDSGLTLKEYVSNATGLMLDEFTTIAKESPVVKKILE